MTELKQTSINFYLKTVKNIFNKLDIKNVNNYINYVINSETKLNTKLNHLNSLISLYKHNKINIKKPDINKLMNIRDKVQSIKEKEMKQDNMTDEQKKILNDVSFDKLQDYKNDLNEIKNDSLKNLHNYILLSLILKYPLRNDMRALKIIYNKSDINNDENFIYIDKKLKNFEIVLNDYKTSGTYGPINIINDDKNLFHDIIKYINETNNIYLFEINNKALTTQQMNRMINKLFNKKFNYKIGMTLIRKIYLNHKYKNKIDNMKQDAKMMGNSLNVQLSNYIKNT